MHAEDIISTSIIATVTLEQDGSYSIGIEDANAPENSETRYLTGVSEGIIFDPDSAGREVERLIVEHLVEPPREWRNSAGKTVA
ncbi:hypothetical protein [Microbacterium sp. MMO-113]|uniref:hypothetical protein n=1 Tax=Microbacterium sp. MMO-113 TaxID=3081273 RepID=UPI003017C30C